jgi:class 3 adenylate cyclase
MRWFDSVLAWLFPSLLVEGTPWSQLWNEKERESFIVACWWCFPVVAAVYLGHYFFYDKPNNLEPLRFWFHFRLFMAASALATFAFYITPAAKLSWYRLPAVGMFWLMAMAQAYIALWHGREAWIFCYILILAAVLVLRMSALKSLLFCGFTISTTAPVLIDAGTEPSLIFTGSAITLAVSLLVRTSYLSDVRSFLLNQENIAAQKRIIELNLEFSERIRSFIPRIIAERIDECMDKKRMSVIEASIEVMAPKTKEVACLFSDIRGFTQQSRDLDAFIKNSVLPEVRACTDAVESYRGIPRKIGDLIFAYFDDDSSERNFLNCVAAGIAVSKLNHDMNATATSKLIRRYVLISCGEALVGNLGGFDSSIEITALGSPVNFLSRVDELTKLDPVRRVLRPGTLVVSEDAGRMLSAVAPGVAQNRIDLAQLGVEIRDFPEVEQLFSIAPDDRNYACILRALDDYERRDVGRRDPAIIAA